MANNFLTVNKGAEQMKKDYPLLWDAVGDIHFREMSDQTIPDFDQELVEAMHELWLARGAFDGRVKEVEGIQNEIDTKRIMNLERYCQDARSRSFLDDPDGDMIGVDDALFLIETIRTVLIRLGGLKDWTDSPKP